MGGDRTCPDDCPLAVWANLAPTDRPAQRKPVAERLYKQGFTMHTIATQLGVHVDTISEDLREFSDTPKIKKQPKTASNPKGAGRPKGRRDSHKSDKSKTQAAALLFLDQGWTREKVVAQTGLGEHEVQLAIERERGRREPQISRDDLSMSAQQKFDSAIRQEKARLAVSFRQEVSNKVKEFVDATVLPQWRQQIDEAKQLFARRRALMDKDTFDTIRRALHPDSRHSISDQKLHEAFIAFMKLEKFLIDEKDSPTKFEPPLPDSWQGWEAAKQKAMQERRARYAAGRSAVKVR